MNQGRSLIFKTPDQQVSSEGEAKLSQPGRQSCRSKNLEVGRNQLNMSDPQKVATGAGGMVPRLRVPAAKSSDLSWIPTVLVVGENGSQKVSSDFHVCARASGHGGGMPSVSPMVELSQPSFPAAWLQCLLMS